MIFELGMFIVSTHGRPQEFSQGGGRALKRPPPQKKGNCAITVLRGLGGMLSRENFNNGALYDILHAFQQGRIYDFISGGGECQINFRKLGSLHGAKHATRGKATRLLGPGACSPEKNFKKGAIWCVLEYILLQFCPKKFSKNVHFLYKNYRYCTTAHYILGYWSILQNVCLLCNMVRLGIYFPRTFS